MTILSFLSFYGHGFTFYPYPPSWKIVRDKPLIPSILNQHYQDHFLFILFRVESTFMLTPYSFSIDKKILFKVLLLFPETKGVYLRFY